MLHDQRYVEKLRWIFYMTFLLSKVYEMFCEENIVQPNSFTFLLTR